MKAKINIKLCWLFLMCLLIQEAKSQVTATNNNSVNSATDYCGWDNSITDPLMIKHEGNYPINFITNAGASGIVPVRMTITGGGNVGIGTTTPGNLMHLHQSSTTSVYSQFTNATNNTNGLWLGVDGTTGNGIINMKDNETIKIFTNDIHRMFIDNGTTATAGYIGIGNSFNAPASRIHMHQNSTGGTAANNDVWLQLTTYATYSGSDPVATDGFRIGVINSSLNAEIKQQENADMNFQTNATQRMTIKADGKVGINRTNPTAQLHVVGTNYGIVSDAGEALTTIAINGNASNYTESSSYNYGLHATAFTEFLSPNYSTNYGSFTESGFGKYNYGIYSRALGISSGLECYGIKAIADMYASGETNNLSYGGYFEALNGTTINYGVFASGGNSCTSTGTSNCAAAGVYCDGALCYTGSFIQPSDAMLKTNINNITDASQLLNQLIPKSYEYNTTQFPLMHLPEGQQFGLLAQDFQIPFPQLVANAIHPEIKDTSGNVLSPQVNYKGINYQPLITLLIKGWQEHEQLISNQQSQIDSLIQALSLNQSPFKDNDAIQLLNQNGGLKVELNNAMAIQLSQNIPNPFDDNTTITFSIPVEVKTAQIIFTENNGIVLKSVTIEQRGESSLTVFGENLSKGIYSYSLIIDGKVFETKKMVKQ